jgi:hypothetical protein
LPVLVVTPFVATQWRQIGPNDVQAVATTALVPSANYTFKVPTIFACPDTGICAASTTVR